MQEGSLCICCMSTHDLVQLFTARLVEGFEVNYAKMLTAFLNIQIKETDKYDSICEKCITQLRGCIAFKSQAIQSMSIISSIDKAVETVAPQPNEATPKRSVGRPRKHPKECIPYKIQPDELKCRECGEEFPKNITLKRHYNTHFRNHVCSACDKGFMTLFSLKKHETSHLEGPFPCETCGREFRNKNTLNSHKRFKHSSLAPFRCRECGARFATLARQLAHAAAAHAPTEPRYPCRYCHRRFQHSGALTKHIVDIHEVSRYPCPLCGVEYKRHYIRAHVLRAHGMGSGLHCTVCGALHASRSALSNHMMSHIDYRRFVCKLCSEAFVQKSTLKTHIHSHIRCGQYHGDPDYLITIMVDPNPKDTGLLEVNEEEELQEIEEDHEIQEDQDIVDQEIEEHQEIEEGEQIEKDQEMEEDNVIEEDAESLGANQHNLVEDQDESLLLDSQLELPDDIDDFILDEDQFELPSDFDVQ